MDKNAVSKIKTMCFMATGVVVWFTVGVLFRALAGAFGVINRLHEQDLFSHGIPLVCGVSLFIFLQLNQTVVVWAEEVILEVSKVVWPSQKDTVGMTIVVGIMVIIASIVLFLFDNLAQLSMEMLDKVVL